MKRSEKKKHAKKKERERRLAQEKHAQQSQPVRDADELDDGAPDEASVWEAERLLRHVAREFTGDAIPSEAEIEQLIETLLERDADELADAVRRDPREFAQEIAFQCFEEGSRDEALALAELALVQDASCVDAIVSRAVLSAENNLAAIAEIERALTIATRRRAGTSGLRELVERRPYLRARRALADELLVVGRIDEGLRHYEEMLDVDSQQVVVGAEDVVAHALTFGDAARAQRVIARYGDELAPFLRWSDVLVRFCVGDRVGSAAALQVARAANRWVEGALLGETVLHPDTEDEGPGSQTEAEWIVETLEAAWIETEGALAWLGDGGLATGDEG